MEDMQSRIERGDIKQEKLDAIEVSRDQVTLVQLVLVDAILMRDVGYVRYRTGSSKETWC